MGRDPGRRSRGPENLGSPRIFCKHDQAGIGPQKGAWARKFRLVFEHPEGLGFAEYLLKQAAIADDFRRRVVAQLPVSIAARNRGRLFAA